MSALNGTRLKDRCDVVVVGAGPTGIAAAYFAAKAGANVVVMERGEIAQTISDFPRGSVVLSPSWHFEIDGIPLDHPPGVCTREDLLSYYSRLMNSVECEVRLGRECVSVHRSEDGLVVNSSRSHRTTSVRATKVIWTSWYRKRTSLLPGQGGPPVLRTAIDLDRLTGCRVVIVGGGLSAYEMATALMVRGSRVTVICRRPLQRYYEQRAFPRLVQATRSRFIHGTSRTRIVDDGIQYDFEGSQHRIACDVIIEAIGTELDRAAVNVMVQCGVFSAEEAGLIEATSTFEETWRQHPSWSLADVVGENNRTRCDLVRQVHGVGGIHVAGGILHGGGANAGTLVSIETARLAANAACSIEEVPLSLDEQLPAALHDWVRRSGPSDAGYSAFARMLLRSRNPVAGHWVEPCGSFPNGGKLALEGAHELEPLSVVAERLGATTDSLRRALMARIRALCEGGQLSWLAPSVEANYVLHA